MSVRVVGQQLKIEPLHITVRRYLRYFVFFFIKFVDVFNYLLQLYEFFGNQMLQTAKQYFYLLHKI